MRLDLAPQMRSPRASFLTSSLLNFSVDCITMLPWYPPGSSRFFWKFQQNVCNNSRHHNPTGKHSGKLESLTVAAVHALESVPFTGWHWNSCPSYPNYVARWGYPDWPLDSKDPPWSWACIHCHTNYMAEENGGRKFPPKM